jgi:hypothetical protein
MAQRYIRPIRICDNVAYVGLTHGREAIVDHEDLPIIEGITWHSFQDKPERFYARGNVKIDGKWVPWMMHRWIMRPSDGMQVDHINGNGLDNRRSNLRIVTSQQNAKNRRMSRHNRVGLKAVTKDRGRYRSYIRVNGQMIHLGMFATPEEAHAAYVAAASTLHGDFANTGT